MQKYKFSGLLIELTRKCNLSCKHCMRGNAQNVTITREVIDKIFENVGNCLRFSFTGGEPLLALDELEYFVDRVIESDYETGLIDLVTNGTIQDKRIMDIFVKFCGSKPGRSAVLSISDDHFHDQEESKAALKYYADIAAGISGMTVRPNGDLGVQNSDGSLEPLILSGRANKLKPDELPETAMKESLIEHRLCIGNKGASKGYVLCELQISANGNVGIMEQRSFQTNDALSLGNILQTPLCEIIERHQANCLISCPELQLLERYENYRQLVKRNNIELAPLAACLAELSADISAAIMRRIMIARKQAHSSWPAIPAQEIIKELPMFDIAIPILVKEYSPSGDVPLDRIGTESRESIERARAIIDADATLEAQRGDLERYAELIAILTTPGKMRVINRDAFWGGTPFFITKQFQRLKELNSLYESGKRAPDNSKIICLFDQGLNEYVSEQMESNVYRKMWDDLSPIFDGIQKNRRGVVKTDVV